MSNFKPTPYKQHITILPALAFAIFATVCATVCALPGSARDIVVPPRGEFAKIDMSPTKKAIAALESKTPGVKTAQIADIEAHSERYAPPIFYYLSSILFRDGSKDRAAFWFYAGQLRGRYDANRCADATARGEIDILNMEFGQPINVYMMQKQNLDKLQETIDKVLAWDKATAHDYDQRWINLHGMGAMMESLNVAKDKGSEVGFGQGQSADKSGPAQMSLPQDQWPQIQQATRDKYMQGFAQTMKKLRARQ